MLMVPSGVGENKLQEAGFMYSMEKSVWYHQGTEFGRRKAENEEKSVEKLVSYLEVGHYLKIRQLFIISLSYRNLEVEAAALVLTTASSYCLSVPRTLGWFGDFSHPTAPTSGVTL